MNFKVHPLDKYPQKKLQRQSPKATSVAFVPHNWSLVRMYPTWFSSQVFDNVKHFQVGILLDNQRVQFYRSNNEQHFRTKSDSICLIYNNNQISRTDHTVVELALNSPVISRNEGVWFLHYYRNPYQLKKDTQEFTP